jgi:poly(A) polymerase
MLKITPKGRMLVKYNVLQRLFCWLSQWRGDRTPVNKAPTVVFRAEHPISRAKVSSHALKVLYGLHNAGYQAYLVGGSVRDLLLGENPKDFDVATDASPEQIQKLFRNCRLIGRRFRLAHIHFGRQIVEVATFRGQGSQDSQGNLPGHRSEEGMILRDNHYGTLEDDVFRRDFTINALYYNIADFSIIDYVGGLKDLTLRRIKMIGNAAERYREDPVRILRAIRFSAKLKFTIDPELASPTRELAHLLRQVPSARLLDEYIKLFLYGFAESSFWLLNEYQLLKILFPGVAESLEGKNQSIAKMFIQSALRDTDQRVRANRSVTLSFLLAAFLWDPIKTQMQVRMLEGGSELFAFYESCDLILYEQNKTLALSRRLKQAIREIWILQIRFERLTRKRVLQLAAHPRFRSAYDFLLLRSEVGEGTEITELAYWWKQFIEADEVKREQMIVKLKNGKDRYRRRKQKEV